MTTTEEKLMRSIARDLTGPFWDAMQAEIALAKIKDHFGCTLCNDMPEGEHCRACGRDTRTATPHMELPAKGTVARAIYDARGGPAPAPAMRGFA